MADSSPEPASTALAASETAEVRSNPESPGTSLEEIANWNGLSYNPYPTETGLAISPDTALRFTAVYSAINIIAETIASMPFSVYEELSDGRGIATTQPVYNLTRTEPNPHQTWFGFWHHLISSTLLSGNGFALIERDGRAVPIALHFLEPGECEPYYMKVGRIRKLYYYVFGNLVEPRDILHITCLGSDGVIGKSPIALAREGIGLGLAAEKFGSSFFGRGAHSSGTLETDQVFKDQGAIDRLRNQFASRYQGLGNAHKPMILEQGMKFSKISIDPTDAQFIETRKFQINEIARLYRVPLHKLQDLERSTNNNIEHQSLEFITDTIQPWVTRIEQECNRKLIREADKGRVYTEFDMDELYRADLKSKGEYYKSLFNIAAISPNEVRQREGFNRYSGGDRKYLQTAMAPIKDDGTLDVPAKPAKPVNDNPKDGQD